MNTWTPFTLAVVTNALPTDLAAAYATWLTANPGKTGRLAELVAETVTMIRASISANPANVLDSATNTVPTVSFRYAVNMVIFNLGMEMGVAMSTEAYNLISQANLWLRMVQDGTVPIPCDDEVRGGTPSYKTPAERGSVAPRLLVAGLVCGLLAGCAHAGWLAPNPSTSMPIVDALTVAAETSARIAGDASNTVLIGNAAAAWAGALTAHTNRADNPHAVTAEQVGAVPTGGIAWGASRLTAANEASAWASMTGGVLVVSRVESVIDTSISSSQLIVTASSGADRDGHLPALGSVFCWDVSGAYILDSPESGVWSVRPGAAEGGRFRMWDSTGLCSGQSFWTPDGSYRETLYERWWVTVAWGLAYTNHMIVTNTYPVAMFSDLPRGRTNEYPLVFAGGAPAGTALLARVNGAQVATQVIARCESGAGTATIYSLQPWSADWGEAQAVASIAISPVSTCVDLWALIGANGGWAVSFTDAGSVTNGMVQLQTVGQ